MTLPSIYFITDDRPFADLLILVREILLGGIRLIQLRDKNNSHAEILKRGRALAHICNEFDATLIINDHISIAQELGLGVHLGFDDGDPQHAREALGSAALIGITIHHDIERAKKYQHIVNYVGVGPVFPTSTKKDARSVLGIPQLTEIVQQSPLPVVAIGGIQKHNIQQVWSAQPASIAMCSAICQSDTPQQTAQDLILCASRQHKTPQ